MKETRNGVGKAVVLLSGGIDSATVLSIAKADGYELYAITFDYGQKHARELESAKSVAEAFCVRKHLVVDFDLRDIGGSALTSDLEVPKEENSPGLRENGPGKVNSVEPPGSGLSIPVTYVPARNTIFLSFALAWAEVLSAGDIFIGANAIDYSGYPDCRPEYLEAFEKMANLATKASIEGRLGFRIKAPLISMKKAGIIRKGIELGLDYALTWSCYDPQRIQVQGRESGYVPCGSCDSCRFRAKGFAEAGVKDPLAQS